MPNNGTALSGADEKSQHGKMTNNSTALSGADG
jgi:hypothetical protein